MVLFLASSASWAAVWPWPLGAAVDESALPVRLVVEEPLAWLFSRSLEEFACANAASL